MSLLRYHVRRKLHTYWATLAECGHTGSVASNSGASTVELYTNATILGVSEAFCGTELYNTSVAFQTILSLVLVKPGRKACHDICR